MGCPMEIRDTVVEYSLIHYKQKHDKTEARKQKRLALITKANGEKTLYIKRLSLWQRIRAKFDKGPASKTAILAFLQPLSTSDEKRDSLEDKVNFIFRKELLDSDIPIVFSSICDCHNRSLIDEILKIPDIKAHINSKLQDGNTPLILAIQNANKEAFNALIATEGIAVNKWNLVTENTALTLAIEMEEIDFVRKLLDKGCEIPVKAFILAKNNHVIHTMLKESSQEQKNHLLLDAVDKSNASALKKIINDMQGLDLSPALEKAIHKGNSEMVDKLLGHGVDKVLALQLTLKEWAKNTTEKEDELLEKMIAHNSRNLHPALAALADLNLNERARSKEQYLQVINSLAVHDSGLDLQGDGAYRVLLRAAEKGNWELVQAMVLAGVNINFEPNGASKILFRAASRGSSEVINMLLAKGADVSYHDPRGNTPLKRAELRLQHGHIPGGREEAEDVLAVLQRKFEDESKKDQPKKEPSQQ